MAFLLVTKIVTLNGIIAIILHYVTDLGPSAVQYVTVVEVRPILSATKM